MDKAQTYLVATYLHSNYHWNSHWARKLCSKCRMGETVWVRANKQKYLEHVCQWPKDKDSALF